MVDNDGRAPLLSPADLAALLQVPLNTVYRWRSAGVGPPALRVGRHTRYRLAEVNRWLDAQADAAA